MRLRYLTLTLATAAMLPSPVLFANPPATAPSCQPGHGSETRPDTRQITALDEASRLAGKDFDLRAADALYSAGFFEVLMDGSVVTRQGWLDTSSEHSFVINSFEFSKIEVVRLNDSSALIRYRIYVDYS